MEALRLKIICTTEKDFAEQSKVLTKRLVERGYNENEIRQQISKTFTIERAHLLNQKRQATSNRIPLILSCNRTLSDMKRAVNKHWDILKINRDFEQVFTELPIIVFRRNRNFQDILGKKTIINNMKQLRQNINQNGYSTPCSQSMLYRIYVIISATPSEVQSHTKPSRYTVNSIATTNT